MWLSNIISGYDMNEKTKKIIWGIIWVTTPWNIGVLIMALVLGSRLF